MKTLFACFSQNLDYALGWMVIHSLWQAIAIALLMGIAMIVLRKKPAKVRYWVANAALLAVLISAMATFSYYYDFSKEPGEVRFIPENSPSLTLLKGEEIESPALGDLEGTPLSWESFKNYFNQHIPLIVLVWAMGVALFILKLLGGISYCYYLRSRLNFPADEYWVEILEKLKDRVGVKQSVELVESALTRTPMVVGHLKPMILFPIGAINKLSPTDVEAILAHEIAHVLRKDFIFNIIQSVIEALFYYHPAVWIISSTIRNERENCCDDVAIEICGNSMDYAKALVTVQEMAYFPMYQPALAFAGNRKNQLLYRVQRILNQPQNKTNVMEKLIATCTLVIVMIGLSFGENTFLKDKLTNNNTPSVENANSTASITSTGETATFYLYFNNKIDSLKVPSEVKNGTYDYEDNTQTATLTVKEGYVVALKVNGIDLEDGQLPNYKRLIDRILRDAINTNKKPERAFEQAGINFDNNGMQLNNNNANLSVDRNGLTLNGVSEGGHSFHLSVDENGFNMNTYDDNGRPLQSTGQTGVFVDNRNNATYIKDGIVTTYDGNGDRWVIKPEKNGIKHIEHFNRNNNLIETLKLQNGKTYINNREATSEELRARGWEITDMGIQKIGGFKNIQPFDNYMKNDKLFPTRTDELSMQRLA
jgi:bla regulator protein blaR1